VPPRPPAAAPAVRDQPVVHLVWDSVLVFITAGLVGAALATTHGAHFADVVRPAGYLGFVAAGLALSLRTGAPNLAVGSIAVFSGALGAHLATGDGWPLWGAMIAAVAVVTAAGLVAGLSAAGLSVPAWAVTFGFALVAESAALVISNSQLIAVHFTSYPTVQWLAAFAVVSVGGGALWLIPGVRTALSAARSAREPGQWAGLQPGIGVVVGLTGSSLLAGIGGVSLTMYLAATDTSGGIYLTFLAFAAVLVGGVSIFGRRAGVLGTLLGVVIVVTVTFLMNVHGISPSWFEMPIGGLVLFGLGVTRALESIADAMNRRPS
jgi:ribose/xylose/arabinose/galactoside ABC-type transport system permease subunit